MLLLFLPLLLVLVQVNALLNVTVDDVDTSMITYQGAWEASSTHVSGLDYGGSHTLSSDDKANASFTFTGVAVYYLSPRWPYEVTSRLRIDDGAEVLVNLTDPIASSTPNGGSESAMYSVLWSATNLANKTHTVWVTYGNYAVVDGFIYTVNNGSSPTSSVVPSLSSSATTLSSPSTSPTQAASSADASTVPSNHKGLTIGLATALPLAALVAAILLVFAFCMRRRKKLQRRPTRTKFVLDDSPPVQPVYASVYPPHRQMSEVSSTSRVENLYPSSGHSAGDVRMAPNDMQYQAFSASSHTALSLIPKRTPSSSLSNPRSMDLPPGAMSPVIQSMYEDHIAPMDTQASSQSLRPPLRTEASTHSLSRLAEESGASGSGSNLRRGISRPPAYEYSKGEFK
ncbi:hypothetical protein R3P38DRAFT_1651879 [Favolaschia claudopus]|uniref:Uncharacterized protein n=1 Tax=Favolaschia claudopus TaxID=2862362 RepID=A0AAW0DJC9_9AGAR